MQGANMPYLNESPASFYICRSINGKHQILKKLGKITKTQAEQKLTEYKLRYEKQRNMIGLQKTVVYKRKVVQTYSLYSFLLIKYGGVLLHYKTFIYHKLY